MKPKPRRETSNYDAVINDVKGRRKFKKTKRGDFLRTYNINKLVINIKKSSFSGMMLTVGRLVRV